MKRVLLAVLRAYRRRISPLLPDRCRYYPSCSEYASESIERFGAARGSLLAVWRLLRCNPLSHGGIDPAPETFTLRRHRPASQVARSGPTSE